MRIGTIALIIACWFASQAQAGEFSGRVESVGPPPEHAVTINGKQYALAEGVQLYLDGGQKLQVSDIEKGFDILYTLSNTPGNVGKIDFIQVRSTNGSDTLTQH